MRALSTSVVLHLFRSSPLRHERFRLFYIGSIGTALGYTMQATLAAWLMTTLTPSAFTIALVQTASTAPSLLFGLAAGTLADIVDRRRMVLFTQILLLTSTLILGAATLAGVIGASTLLALTFAIGVGFTFYMPAQQALVNDLVPRPELPPAVALSAVAFNVARAVGPALAGALAAWLGTGSALLASALAFVWMIVALRGWPNPARSIPGVPETLLSGVLSGLRYLRHSPPMRAFVTRNLSFSVCASALWALLPVIARDELGAGAGGFGILLGFFGAGAVIGALWIPRHLQKASLNTVVTGGFLLWAVAALVIAFAPIVTVAVVGTCAAGAAWVSVLASLSAGTQTTAPAWVRARAVAINLVSVQSSLALGSVVWGALASASGTRIALSLSSGVLMLLLAISRRVRVALGHEADVTTGVQLPELSIAVEPLPDDGPVLIQIEYRVDPENREAFLRVMREIEAVRRRNGASSWRMFRDLEDPGRYVERFVLSSWAEYLRLRSRMTVADRELQERVQRLHTPDAPIRISRFIGVAPTSPVEQKSDASQEV
ncbi:MAG TPA: MFS transporter [Burkholderiales bacterium]|nr:MFS transporter [Burkholderiales bacterium]